MPRIFATKVWGFDPERWAATVFSREGSRDALAAAIKPEDFVLYIGTNGSPTEPRDFGRLLGLMHVDSTHVMSEDLVEPAFWLEYLQKTGGQVKWPYGLPISEAWYIADGRFEWDVLPRLREENLAQTLATHFVTLEPDEVDRVLALPRVHVQNIYSSSATEAARGRQVLRAGLRKTTGAGRGIRPTLGKREVAISVQDSFTYCMELLGDELALKVAGLIPSFRDARRVYKIGWSVDYKERQKALNFAFPNPGIVGWVPIIAQPRPSQLDAYNLEQLVLSLLSAKRLAGRAEMVFCLKADVESAFIRAAQEAPSSKEPEQNAFVLNNLEASET